MEFFSRVARMRVDYSLAGRILASREDDHLDLEYEFVAPHYTSAVEELVTDDDSVPESEFDYNPRDGLTKNVIDNQLKITNPLKRKDRDSNLEEYDDCCAICQENLHKGSRKKIGILDCGHKHHAVCIKRWLLKRNICPVCREKAIDTAS